jgi:hypothetical protein
MRLLKIRNMAVAMLAILFCFLSACNKTDWAVKWADTYVSWKIIDQFDFSGDAKKTVKTETSNLLHQIRHEKFPMLAQLFHRSFLEAANLDFKSEDIVHTWVLQKLDESDAFLNDLIPILQPYASRIATLVQKENFSSFLKSFEAENQKILKSKSKCSSKFADELDDWMGSLSEFQVAAIDHYCQTRIDSQEVRVRNRVHILEVFRSWAEPAQTFDKTQFESAVKRWLSNYRKVQSPESEAKWKISREELVKAMTQILLNANDVQKKRLAATLEERSKSFQRLSL